MVIYNDYRILFTTPFDATLKGRSASGAPVQAFEYVSATSKEQVSTLLADNASILAGGTDLLALMKDYIITPRRLVNIKQVEQLRGISYQPRSGLRIGALTTIAELADARTELAAYPALLEAANEAASPQIRNLATIGGNMCQRPRCWYFRNGMGLMPKAPRRQVDGRRRRQPLRRGPRQRRPGIFRQPIDHRSGADRLWSEDPPLLSERPARVRELPLEKFFIIPRAENELEHDLKPGEIVMELVVPPPAAEPEGRQLRGAAEGRLRLAARHRNRRAGDGRQHGPQRARGVGARCANSVGLTGSSASLGRQEHH